jgi:hypothetical protein
MLQMITCRAFSPLPDEDKYNILDRYGVYLLKRTVKGSQVALFDLCGFYVEVTLNEKTGQLRGAVAFTDTTRLAPYLGLIDISSLVK